VGGRNNLDALGIEDRGQRTEDRKYFACIALGVRSFATLRMTMK